MAADFSEKFLEQQRQKLLELKMKLANSLNSTEDFQMSSDDLPDEGDLSQAILNQNYAISLRERDLSRLKDIEEALMKIEDGTYGYCEESGDPIGKMRLQKIPWTRLSIESAEEIERQTHRYKRLG